MFSIKSLAKMPKSELETFVSNAGIQVPASTAEILYRTATILSFSDNLAPEDIALLKSKDFWTFLQLSRNIPESIDHWKVLNRSKPVVLYVDPKDVGYLETVRDKLLSGGVRIFAGEPSKRVASDVFYLTSSPNIEDIKNAIDNYGDFSTIIAIELDLAASVVKHSMTPEYYTITSYSPEWLADYLLTPVDPTLPPLTYLVSGFSGIKGGYLHKRMRGWKLIYKPRGFIDYLSHNVTTIGVRDKSLNNLPTGMRNVSDVDQLWDIVDKTRLYGTFQKIDPNQNVVLPAKDLDQVKTIESSGMGDVLIVRPIGAKAFSGRGIFVVTSNEELEKARMAISDNKDWVGATVSPYLTDPMLYEGRKMHLRVLILVTSWGTTVMHKKSDITLAKLPYKKSDYGNKDIHDTHLKDTDKYVVFPDEFPPDVVPKMQEGLDEIFRLITKAIRGCVRSYPESNYGFDALGLDVMFREDGSAVLIEVNTNAGFNVIYEEERKNDYYRWYELLNEMIYENTVAHYLTTVSPLTIRLIERASVNQLKELAAITSDVNTMKNIGDGKPWTYEKILGMKSQAEKDYNNKQYYDWLIISNQSVVGYIALKPVGKGVRGVNPDQKQIRVFVGEKRRGHAVRAISLAIHEYWKAIGKREKIWSFVKTSNLSSVGLFKKAGWLEDRAPFIVYGSSHHLFSIE
jgi:hypothetical protein